MENIINHIIKSGYEPANLATIIRNRLDSPNAPGNIALDIGIALDIKTGTPEMSRLLSTVYSSIENVVTKDGNLPMFEDYINGGLNRQ